MTHDTTNHDQAEPGPTSAADETFAWSAEPESNTSGASGQAREWLSQLQSMIEDLATQAAPVIREVGAKAAELAAMAGDKAGPVAQRAAVLTGQAGQKLAERSRDLAAELRRDQAAEGGEAPKAEPEAAEEPPTVAGVH